ncbi:MAG: CAP domain-containing protein [Salinivirgaceae bacterium]|nr:CAP domain-containing protein [Salinivirgaceae bacterium]
MKIKFFSIIALTLFYSTITSCDITNDLDDDNSLTGNNTATNTAATIADATKAFSQEQIDMANTAKDASYLTDEEKLVIQYCNLARLDGDAFSTAFLADLKSSDNSYEKSLLDTLESIKNLPMLVPNEQLCKAAEFHANDIGPKGERGHNSTDGTSFADRVRSYYDGVWVGENISYGYNDALKIVRQLLIDKNVESLGHRKNILNDNYCRIGVAIREHKEYNNCCVQDFSDSKGDK